MSDVQLTLALRDSQAFASLSDAQLRQLVQSMRRVVLDEAGVLFESGEAGGTLYLLLEGVLLVEWGDGLGAHQVAMARIQPGEFAGEMGLFDQAPRSATVRAETACVLYEFAFEDLVLLEEACPQAASALIGAVGKNLAARIHAVNEALEGLVVPDVPRMGYRPAHDNPPPARPADAPPRSIGHLWARLTR
ncbi:MAG: cyclic nucleotide-binding domain-containing protein [Myxococcota bacterium]